jgi:hypothetical protein
MTKSIDSGVDGGMPSLFLLQEPQVLLLKSQLLFFVSLPSFQIFYVVIKKLNGFR